jgi:hypothetical protein
MAFPAIYLKECEKINPQTAGEYVLANPPSRRSQLIHKLVYLVFGSLVFGILSFFLIGSPIVYGKDQHQVSRLTNNKTFYATEVPLLKPAPSSLIAMRHVPTFEPISMAFDAIKAKKLAEIAKSNARYKSSRRKCMRWVRLALGKWMGKTLDLNSLPNDPKSHKKIQNLPGLSGENFKNWALNNPVSLCQNLKLANVTEYPDLVPQEGAVYLYGKGTCGFNRRYGHAEILTDSAKGIACSDHCRTISQPCKPDVILASVSHCDWIHREEKKDLSFPLNKNKPILMTKYIEARPPAK